MKENQLPPDQRAAAHRERALQKHEDWVAGLNAARRRDEQRAETRMMQAFQSPKWGNKLVAEHFLPWLKKEGYVDASHDAKRAVEVLLWRLVSDPQMASWRRRWISGRRLSIMEGCERRIMWR
jgi:hypothetical protein